MVLEHPSGGDLVHLGVLRALRSEGRLLGELIGGALHRDMSIHRHVECSRLRSTLVLQGRLFRYAYSTAASVDGIALGSALIYRSTSVESGIRGPRMRELLATLGFRIRLSGKPVPGTLIRVITSPPRRPTLYIREHLDLGGIEEVVSMSRRESRRQRCRPEV